MKKVSRNWSNIILVALIVATLVAALPAAQAQRSAPGELRGGDSTIFGKTYGEWQAAWWQWALAMPATAHPLFDTAGCSTGQSGNVLFLGGKFCAGTSGQGCEEPAKLTAERYCTISASTALFFPILNADDSIVEELPWNSNVTEADLRHNVKSWEDPNPDGFMAVATVDGKQARAVRICTQGDYCTPEQSPLIPFTLPAHDNLFTAIGEIGIPDGASSYAVADGYYVFLPPLSVGQHTIHLYGFTASFGGFSLDVTYHITVAPPQP